MSLLIGRAALVGLLSLAGVFLLRLAVFGLRTRVMPLRVGEARGTTAIVLGGVYLAIALVLLGSAARLVWVMIQSE